MHGGVPGWPDRDDELIALQDRLALDAVHLLATDPFVMPEDPIIGGCFVAYAPGEAGSGAPGDRAWAAAVAWRPTGSAAARHVDHHLRGTVGVAAPRRADDVIDQAVVAARVPASYRPGLLARREGPILGAAVSALRTRPDVLLVDATGLDHPRRAGLALHLGAVSRIPTVGVTRRPLAARGTEPALVRGGLSALEFDRSRAGYFVCTSTGARAIVAHAAWRTSPETAAAVVLAASTEGASTPVPLQEARRVAREARSLAASRWT